MNKAIDTGDRVNEGKKSEILKSNNFMVSYLENDLQKNNDNSTN